MGLYKASYDVRSKEIYAIRFLKYDFLYLLTIIRTVFFMSLFQTLHRAWNQLRNHLCATPNIYISDIIHDRGYTFFLSNPKHFI